MSRKRRLSPQEKRRKHKNPYFKNPFAIECFGSMSPAIFNSVPPGIVLLAELVQAFIKVMEFGKPPYPKASDAAQSPSKN